MSSRRRDEALAPAEEAVAIRRRLVQQNPAAYLPDLAASLNNLGIRLSGLGRREEALGPVEEAVAIRRRLVQQNPAAYLPDLAMSLWGHAWVCVHTEADMSAALASVEESIDLYQQLAKQLPLLFAPYLSSAQQIRADVLDRLGRTGEAADIRHQFDQESPGPTG